MDYKPLEAESEISSNTRFSNILPSWADKFEVKLDNIHINIMLFTYYDYQEGDSFLAMFLVMFVVTCIVFVCWYAIRHFVNASLGGFLGSHEFVFTESDFFKKYIENEYKFKYSSIERVFTRFDAIYIKYIACQVTRRAIVIIFPKRDFANEEDYYKLLALLQSKSLTN